MTQTSHYPIGIGELSKRTNCKVETIRFYEHKGMLPEPPRTEGGHRLYNAEMVDRLYFIRRSRELGFSMDEVRQLLSLVDGRQISCERVKTIADEHLRNIRTRIADLRKMQRTLADIAGRCSGKDVPECPIIDMLQNT